MDHNNKICLKYLILRKRRMTERGIWMARSVMAVAHMELTITERDIQMTRSVMSPRFYFRKEKRGYIACLSHTH